MENHALKSRIEVFQALSREEDPYCVISGPEPAKLKASIAAVVLVEDDNSEIPADLFLCNLCMKLLYEPRACNDCD